MAEVTGRIGDQDVALDNAATEATLRDLLAAMKGQTAVLSKLTNTAGQAGISPQAIAAANKGLQQMSPAFQAGTVAGKALGVVFSGLSKGAMILGGVLGDIVASGLQTGKNLIGFADQLLEGTASVSNLFAAFKDLPLGVGVVAGLFEKFAKMQEANLTAFRDLSKVGVNLGGDLNQVRLQALEVGLTMQEYGAIISANASTIALMGTNAESGAKAFRNINRMLTTGDLGGQLLSLGYSFKDINELTANYVKVQGGLTSSQKKDYAGVAASVAAYGKELDVLARLTGKSREQLEKEQEQMTQDANFQSYLNGLDEKEREKANAALRLAMASGGKGAADALKAKLMGLPPLTEEAQMYMATMKDGGKSIDEFSDIVKNGKTLQESQLALDKAFSSAVAGNIKDMKQFETVMRAGGMTGDKFAQTMMGVQEAVNKYKAQGLTEEAAITKAIQEERKKQSDQNNSAAASAAEVEKQMKNLGAQLMGSLLPIFEALTPIINNLAKSFMEFLSGNMPVIKTAMTELATFISNFAKDLFSQAGRDKIINDLKYYFGLVMIEVKKAIVPFYNEKDADKDKAKLDLEKAAADSKAELARTELEITSRQSKLNNEKSKLTDEQRTQLQKEISDLEKKKSGQQNLSTKAGEANARVEEGNKTVSGWSGAAAGAASLGSAGALLGSVIPVVGTAVGAAIGAALGGAAGGLGLIDYGLKDYDPRKELNSLPKAANGGVFDGPESGYNVELHGKEKVVPIKDDLSSSPPTKFEENLLVELQQLNKQTAQMLSYMRETNDFTRRNLDAIRGLNGNLLI